MYQNCIVTKALKYFAEQHGKNIEQKILVKGYTRMLVGSVHSCNQRTIGQQSVSAWQTAYASSVAMIQTPLQLHVT